MHKFISIILFSQVNHFPGTFQIGRKDRLWRNLSRMLVHHGKKVSPYKQICVNQKLDYCLVVHRVFNSSLSPPPSPGVPPEFWQHSLTSHQFCTPERGSTLAVVRSSETTIKCYGRVLRITNSSGGRVSFKEQIFFNFHQPFSDSVL